MSKYNVEKVNKYLEYFNVNYSNEFSIALLISDRLDVNVEDVTEDLVNNVGNILDKYDSIYNEYLNEDLYELEEELNEQE